MSTVHAIEPGAETRHDGDELHNGPLQVGEPIPAACTVADICRIFQIGRSTFYAHRRDYDTFLLRGRTDRWSGYRIAQHLRAGATSITVKRS